MLSLQFVIDKLAGHIDHGIDLGLLTSESLRDLSPDLGLLLGPRGGHVDKHVGVGIVVGPQFYRADPPLVSLEIRYSKYKYNSFFYTKGTDLEVLDQL